MTLVDLEKDVSDEVTETPAPRRRGLEFWAPLALLVLLLGAIVANLFVPLPLLSGKSGSNLADQEEARSEICAFAPTLATYDYKDLNPYFNGVLARATGDFKDQFTKGKAELGDWLKQGEVVSRVNGVSCGVDASGDQLKIIIGITQGIASIATQGSVDSTLSVVADVEKIGGKWVISKLDGPLLAK